MSGDRGRCHAAKVGRPRLPPSANPRRCLENARSEQRDERDRPTRMPGPVARTPTATDRIGLRTEEVVVTCLWSCPDGWMCVTPERSGGTLGRVGPNSLSACRGRVMVMPHTPSMSSPTPLLGDDVPQQGTCQERRTYSGASPATHPHVTAGMRSRQRTSRWRDRPTEFRRSVCPGRRRESTASSRSSWLGT
jgi:hypothetical protein